MKTLIMTVAIGLLLTPVAFAQKIYRIPYTDLKYGYSAEFPTPRPIQLYRVKFEHDTINNDGLVGWKSGLPVYGEDNFVVYCFEIGKGPLQGKSDLEIIRYLLRSVGGIDKVVPDEVKLGKEKWDGLEIFVTYSQPLRERYRGARIGDKFYMLCASCADSQPNPNIPDPFSTDFVDSPTVLNFFDSFELKR